MNLKNSRMIPQAPNSRQGIVDSRLSDIYQLLPPVALVEKFPATDFTDNLVKGTRKVFHDILCDSDDRLVVIAGPCSIHDPKAALDYAARLLELRKRYADQLEIIMRVYFEKPRTTIGWKGLINDPDLDGSYDINNGLRIARKLLRDLNEMGMPAATEYLDTISPIASLLQVCHAP